jgi:hypothetical protein
MRGKTESGAGEAMREVRRSRRDRGDESRKQLQADSVQGVRVPVEPERKNARTEEIIVISGRRFRVVYDTYGPYIRSDGKGVIEGVRFTGVVPA